MGSKSSGSFMHSGNAIQFRPSMDGQHGRHGTCLRPVAVTDEDMQIIEEFVVLMYEVVPTRKWMKHDWTCLQESSDHMNVFYQHAALKEHCKRSGIPSRTYGACHSYVVLFCQVQFTWDSTRGTEPGFHNGWIFQQWPNHARSWRDVNVKRNVLDATKTSGLIYTPLCGCSC